jgi:hypothetical protein
MISLPFSITVDIPSLLAGFSLPVVAGWLASFLSLRKDERSIEIEQVTTERAKWRDNMRQITKEIAAVYFENKESPVPGKVAGLRGTLATSINPKDDEDDKRILSHFDELFTGNKSDLDVFSKRIALLLKHDWERVKWDCKPIYIKLFTRFSKKQRKWRAKNYRHVG